MELSASRLLPVDRDTAWHALNDPERLKAAIAGCESLERTGENEFATVLAASIGPVKARFRGKLTLVDVVPPERYTIHFEGQGGPAGFGKGSAAVSLTPEGGRTRLDYKVNAQVGGRIAQAGQRLIDAAAAKIADDFFDAFTAQLGGTGTTAPDEASREAATPSSSAPLWVMAALFALLVLMPFVFR